MFIQVLHTLILWHVGHACCYYHRTVQHQFDRRMRALSYEMTGQADKQGEQLRRIKSELYARRFKNAVDITMLRKKVDELLAEVERQKEEATSSNERYANLKSSYETLVKENEENKSAVAHGIAEACIEGLVAGMEEQLMARDNNNKSNNASQELQDAQSAIRELESRVMAKDDSIAMLESEVASTRTTLTALEQSKSEAEKTIEDLKANIASFTTGGQVRVLMTLHDKYCN